MHLQTHIYLHNTNVRVITLNEGESLPGNYQHLTFIAKAQVPFEEKLCLRTINYFLFFPKFKY